MSNNYEFLITTNHKMVITHDSSITPEQQNELRALENEVRNYLSERLDSGVSLDNKILEIVKGLVEEPNHLYISSDNTTLKTDFNNLRKNLSIKTIVVDDSMNTFNQSNNRQLLSVDREWINQNVDDQFIFSKEDFNKTGKNISILEKTIKYEKPLEINNHSKTVYVDMDNLINKLPDYAVIKFTDKYLTFTDERLSVDVAKLRGDIKERLFDRVDGKYVRISGDLLHIDYEYLRDKVLAELSIGGDDYINTNPSYNRIDLALNISKILTTYLNPLEVKLQNSIDELGNTAEQALKDSTIKLLHGEEYLYLNNNHLGLSKDRLKNDIKSELQTLDSTGNFLTYTKGHLIFNYSEYADWLKIPNADEFVPKVDGDLIKLSNDRVLYIDKGRLRDYIFDNAVDNTFIEYKNNVITLDYYKLLDTLRDEIGSGGGNEECSYEDIKENNPYWKQSLNVIKTESVFSIEGVINLSFIPRGDIISCEIKDPNIPNSWIHRDDLKPVGTDSKRCLFKDGLPNDLINQLVRVSYLA